MPSAQQGAPRRGVKRSTLTAVIVLVSLGDVGRVLDLEDGRLGDGGAGSGRGGGGHGGVVQGVGVAEARGGVVDVDNAGFGPTFRLFGERK